MSSSSIAYKVILATVFGMVLPTIAVAARLLARKVQRLSLYLDDYFILMALVFKLAIDAAGCILIENGMGRHITTLSARQLITFLQVQYTGSILYPCCIAFTKLSILIQYRRIFSTPSFRWLTNVIMGVITVWCISVCFTGIFLCHPIEKAWYPMTPGSCINLVSFYYGLQIPNVVTDLAILILPIKEVIGLDLPKRQKIGVTLTCLLWILALAFGIVRLIVMINLSRSKSMDLTYDIVSAAIWTTIEPAIAIVTACLPSARVLYRTANNYHTNRIESQRLRSLSIPVEEANQTQRNDSITTQEEYKSEGGVGEDHRGDQLGSPTSQYTQYTLA